MPADTDLKSNSDEYLFSLVKTGDTLAFSELYHRYSHRLLHYLLRMLNGDESRAQDLLQDVFLRVLDKRNQFQQSKNFSTWIYTIAVNLCKNEYRSRKIHQTVNLTDNKYSGELIEDSPDTPMGRIDLDNFTSRVRLLLKSLPADQRSAFLLRFQENLSLAEIAQILNCPPGTVKSRLHYALTFIAARLKFYNPNKSEVL